MPKPVVNGHDDSAYGGQKFDVEKSQFPEDAAAPELQLNRKGLGNIGYQTRPACICVVRVFVLNLMFLRCKID